MVIESFLRLNTNIITYELMPKIHNYFLGENVLSVFLKMNCFDHCIILLYPSSSQTRTSIAKLPVGNSFFIKQWKSSLPISQLTVSAEEMNLSTAIVHLLSIKSVAASKVAGQASAAKSAAERMMFFIFECNTIIQLLIMLYSIIWYEVWLCMK